MSLSRRTVLATIGGSVTALAGCSETTQPATDRTDVPETASDSPSESADNESPTSANEGSAVADGSWPMVEFDAGNTNHNPTATGFAEQPTQQWRQPFVVGNSSGLALLEAPLLADGYLIVDDGTGDVFAISTSDGEVGIGADGSHSLPYEYEGHIPSIATGDRYYGVAFHRETDTVRFVAHDLQGQVIWEADVPAVDAVAAGETVLVTVGDQDQPMAGVAAFDRATGTEQWRQTVETEASPFVAASPDRVFVAHQQRVSAYDTVTGERRWQFDLPEPAVDADLRFGRPRITAGHVLVAASGQATQSSRPRLWALPRDGPPARWGKEAEINLVPRIVTETVAVVGDGAALALDTGDEQWANGEAVQGVLDSEYGPQTVWDRVASENTLLLGTGPTAGTGEYPGVVAGLNLQSGDLQWQVDVESGVRHLVVVDEGLLVVTQEGAIEQYR